MAKASRASVAITHVFIAKPRTCKWTFSKAAFSSINESVFPDSKCLNFNKMVKWFIFRSLERRVVADCFPGFPVQKVDWRCSLRQARNFPGSRSLLFKLKKKGTKTINCFFWYMGTNFQFESGPMRKLMMIIPLTLKSLWNSCIEIVPRIKTAFVRLSTGSQKKLQISDAERQVKSGSKTAS